MGPIEPFLLSFVTFFPLLAGVGLLAGGVALLVGCRTRIAAIGLIALLIPITITVQLGGMATMGPLFKNIGLAGGLIFFATHGAGPWSLDRLWHTRGAQHPSIASQEAV